MIMIMFVQIGIIIVTGII